VLSTLKDFLLNVWRFLAYFVMDLILHVVYRAGSIGSENIPKSGGVFIASNHLSGMDIPIIPYFAVSRLSSRKFYSPGKEELFRFLPASLLFGSLRAFPIKRKSRDVAGMQRIIDLVKDNIVVIYPEGTRSRDGILKPGQPGMGRLIYESKVSVVPTLVINTNMLFKGKLPNFSQRMYVVFGKPLNLEPYFSREGTKDNFRQIVKYLMDEIAKLKEEYRHLDSMPVISVEKPDCEEQRNSDA